jgi:hypothetical protein
MDSMMCVKWRGEMASTTWLLLLVVGFLSGCATQKMSGDQLARVAKDWSLSIRASQVIPVYPLTEDLQPGDVFLVQTPIEEQVKVYLDKGFLPLENLVTRLSVLGYARFYRGWPFVEDGDKARLAPGSFPRRIPRIRTSRARRGRFPDVQLLREPQWGLERGHTVQSVPLALNLLDSASANRTITLKDVFTYALPARTMFDAIHQWCRDNVDYLKQFAPTQVRHRKRSCRQAASTGVINRVYLVKAVDVSLFSNRGFGSGGSAGIPSPCSCSTLQCDRGGHNLLPSMKILSNAVTPAKREKNVEWIGAQAKLPAPQPPVVGGTVKLAMATSRSVSLVETFHRPLVISYLASGLRYWSWRSVRGPGSDLSILERRNVTAGQPIAYQGCDENVTRSVPGSNKGNNGKLEAWLEKEGGGIAIADLLTGDYAVRRQRVVTELIEMPH